MANNTLFCYSLKFNALQYLNLGIKNKNYNVLQCQRLFDTDICKCPCMNALIFISNFIQLSDLYTKVALFKMCFYIQCKSTKLL